MPKILNIFLSFIAGTVLAFVLIVAVELFSSVVHPVPPGFTGTID